ncbi:MAG: hypothetical protein R6U44_09260 [Archaeoglobaceae archaeon]
MDRLYVIVMLAAVAGLGVTGVVFASISEGDVNVSEEEISISPGSYTINMENHRVYPRKITVSTDEEENNIHLKVLPANYDTAEEWGINFVAFAERTTIDTGPDGEKVNIIHYAEEPGNYKVKIIAAKD